MAKLAAVAAALMVAGALTVGAMTNKPVSSSTLPGPDVKIAFTVVKDADNTESTGTCSGVYIGNNVVVTAKHCLTPEGYKVKSAEVIFDQDGQDGIHVGATALWTSDKNDVGAYKLDDNIKDESKHWDAKSAELACRDPKIGEPIEVVGNPLGVSYVHTWGKVAGVARQLGDSELVVPIDVAIASGNSGGPVYDAFGKILGIAVAVIDGNPFNGSVGHVDLMISSQAVCGQFAK